MKSGRWGWNASGPAAVIRTSTQLDPEDPVSDPVLEKVEQTALLPGAAEINTNRIKWFQKIKSLNEPHGSVANMLL